MVLASHGVVGGGRREGESLVLAGSKPAWSVVSVGLWSVIFLSISGMFSAAWRLVLISGHMALLYQGCCF